MQALDLTALFSRAEQSFVSGRLAEAKANLDIVIRHAGDHPAVLHLLALVEKRLGNAESAESAFAKALQLDPHNREIATNAGNFFSGIGEYGRALAAYQKALAVSSDHLPAMQGRARCLAKLGRADEARAEWKRAIEVAPTDAKGWTGLAALERDLQNLDEAANAYDRALAISPSSPVAVHGRARVALERGETEVQRLFAKAQNLLPNDREVALGAAEAAVAVDQEEALRRLNDVIAKHPDWPEPHAAIARLRWERNEHESFVSTMEERLKLHPRNAELWHTLISALSGVDRHTDAANAAARAAAVHEDEPLFRLLEAANVSEGGDLSRADQLFEALPPLDMALVPHARHKLKSGDIDRAASLLERAREKAPEDVSAWAWTGIVWRLLGDARANWLYQPELLLRTQQLRISEDELAWVADEIVKLHHAQSFPIGQSLRGGTQTRGRLFTRLEPAVAKLRCLITDCVRAYWSTLPEDPLHPLLRHVDRTPLFAGSWSVRLAAGGFHVAHIHPRGLLSSACYLLVPPALAGNDGCLELGSAPPDLGLNLDPLAVVKPQPGHLSLFPSYVFHGTRPFQAGERLTVAFDVRAG